MTGLINLDFADVKSVMQNAGTALMAVGEGHGDGRAVAAARAAISSPLLDVSIEGAKGVLLNVSGGPDLTLAEVTEAAETIQAEVDPDANIFFGAVIHPRVQDEVRVTVIATGLKDSSHAVAAPHRAPVSEPAPPPREPEPRPRFNVPDPSRERDIDPERRRPTPGEWERGRPRQEPPRAPQPPAADDDWDVPSFLRRPRR
jgi:cell division protein FtsZ